DEQLAHMRQVEQPDALTDRSMLVEDRAVLDGHLPAVEVDHPGAQRLVSVREWCLVDDGAGPHRVGHEARSARDAPRRAAAWATSARSVSKVSTVGASSKSIQRTSSNSWSWRARSPPTGSIMKHWT